MPASVRVPLTALTVTHVALTEIRPSLSRAEKSLAESSKAPARQKIAESPSACAFCIPYSVFTHIIIVLFCLSCIDAILFSSSSVSSPPTRLARVRCRCCVDWAGSAPYRTILVGQVADRIELFCVSFFFSFVFFVFFVFLHFFALHCTFFSFLFIFFLFPLPFLWIDRSTCAPHLILPPFGVGARQKNLSIFFFDKQDLCCPPPLD